MRRAPRSPRLFAGPDPTRRGLLARLATGDATVTDLATPYDMSIAAISKHLKVLENAGLISRGRDAQWRPARLEADRLREAAKWMERYRIFWEQSLDRLDPPLRQLQGEGKKHGRRKQACPTRAEPRHDR